MKKWLLILFLISYGLDAQEWHAWVYFTDKPNVTSSINNPSTILTARAIARKARHGIVIDQRDVPVNQQYVAAIKNATGISYKAQSKWFNCVHVTGAELDLRALENLSFVDRVEFADPSKSILSTSQDKFTRMSSAPFNYGNASNQIVMMGLDNLHNQDYTGDGVHVAVMDSGFPNVDSMSGFSQLRGQNGILGGYDFVDRNATYADDYFHGTWVLSTMAGHITGQFEGAAPNASYWLFRTEEAAQETPAELSYWVAAAERADSLGVDVINTSLGYLAFDNASESLTYNDMDGQTSFASRGANVAFEKGMLVITSAGNSGNSTNHPYISSPADAQGAIAVGAVDASSQRTVFSSIGPSFDNRIKPDLAAQGGNTAIIDHNDNLRTANGTSFSSPLLAGGVACLLEAFPNLTPQQIRSALEQNASQSNSPDNLLGYGIPDFGLLFQTLSQLDQSTKEVKWHVVNQHLHLDKELYPKIQIYSIQGQLLIDAENSGRIVLTDLSKGIYLLKVDESGKWLKIVNR